jgi:hypothetical protein
MARVFLLSPASLRGKRAAMLLRPAAEFDLALRVRRGGAPIGEVFAFLSGLYFRGKLAYARAFATPPSGVAGAFVITAGHGLVETEHVVDAATLQSWSTRDIAADDEEYRRPLERDARTLASALGGDGHVVLLGSIATDKYVSILGDAFGERLVFPQTFVGRGDMSRGGLLLRATRAREELAYAPVLGAVRRGARPPRLERERRAR